MHPGAHGSMTKRKRCLVLLLIAATGVGAVVRHRWVLAKGRQEIVPSFAADKSGMENRFLDFPTRGPIVCDSATFRFPHRALAGRFDPIAFEKWARDIRHSADGVLHATSSVDAVNSTEKTLCSVKQWTLKRPNEGLQ